MPSRNRARTTIGAGILALLCTITGSAPVFMVTAQAPNLYSDIGITASDLGIAVSSFFLAASVGSVIAGRLSRRLGPAQAGGVGAVLSTASCLVIVGMVQGVVSLCGALALAGLGNAFSQISANMRLVGFISASRLGVAFGVKQSATPLAVLVGGVALSGSSAQGDWRSWFIYLAAFTLALGIYVVVSGDSRSDHAGAKVERTAGSNAARVYVPYMVLFMVCLTLVGAISNSLASFLPSWAVSVGISTQSAGVLLAVCSFSAASMRVLSGALTQRIGKYALYVMAGMSFIGAGGLFLLSIPTTRSVVVGALIAFAIGWAWPGLALFFATVMHASRPGEATGAVQAGTFAGAALGPGLFGTVVEAYSFEMAWSIGAGVGLVAAATMCVAQWLARRSTKDERAPVSSGSYERCDAAIAQANAPDTELPRL
ncbi:MFS transporter [Ornithinimicrobium faecis]|uniref:MFS transporter n=1 Tax=Ornithinimicrobium faecis TaxID=2934158 RepID=UPI002117348B|nr:MFS transporter [Ornithinimicrobium sp. HY1745]